MTQIAGSSWWRPYETASQQYRNDHAGAEGTLAHGLTTDGCRKLPFEFHHGASESAESPHNAYIQEDNDFTGTENPAAQGSATPSPIPRQNDKDRRDASRPACIPGHQTLGSPVSCRKAKALQQQFVVSPSCKTVLQKSGGSRRAQRSVIPKADSSESGTTQKEKSRSPSLVLNGEEDRLGQVESILDQLIHEAKLLRIENIKLRAAKKDLFGTAEEEEADSGCDKDSALRLRCEVDVLRRRLREKDETLRSIRYQSAYREACLQPMGGSSSLLALEEPGAELNSPIDEKTFKERLLCKEEALEKSRNEVSALRSELELLKSSDNARKAEVEELRARCKELKCLLLERQQELQRCAKETVSIGAEAAAAKGAQLNKAWELEQMERRFQNQLNNQVAGRLNLEAGKHEAENEVERLRVAFRSIEDRALCQAEQLQDRDEEVQLLQQQVDRLCRQREQDAAKLKDQRATMLRWRTYILFLEKLIRDLRSYILSQAAAFSPVGFHAASDSRLKSCAASSGRTEAVASKYRQMQKEERRPRGAKTKSHTSPKSQGVNRELPGSLAAVGYNLLPFPFSPFESAIHQSVGDWSPGRRETSPLQSVWSRQPLRSAPTSSQNDGSTSIEKLERLMQEAADALRATAAASRRGQISSRLEASGRCCNRPFVGGGSSPGSTVASSTNASEACTTYYACGGNDYAAGRPPSECLEAFRGRDVVYASAHTVLSARSPVHRRGWIAHGDAGSMTDPGSMSDVSALLEAPRRRGASCKRWLNKGAAASHLAKEISIRFPTAFDRLRKSSPTWKLPGRK